MPLQTTARAQAPPLESGRTSAAPDSSRRRRTRRRRNPRIEVDLPALVVVAECRAVVPLRVGDEEHAGTVVRGGVERGDPVVGVVADSDEAAQAA